MDKGIKLAVFLTAFDKMSDIVNKAFGNAEKKAKGIEKFSKGLGQVADKSLIAGGVASAFFGTSINAAEESEIAINRLNQVFKSMGETNDEAARKSADYASKLQFQIGVEDEVIMAAQAKIATFKHVSDATARMNGVFERATAAAFDMQATGFGDAAGNAVQLGKALEDPIRGITALRKSGITFSEAEREKIKVLVESGKLHKAQELILKAVEKQVGGVAKATSTQAAKARVAFSEMQESVGRILLPTFNKLADKLIKEVLPKIQAFVDKHPKLVKWVAAAGFGLLIFGGIMKVTSFLFGGLSTAINATSAVYEFFFLKVNGATKFMQIAAVVQRAFAAAFAFTGNVINVVSKFLMANPIILIITAIALVALLIYKYWEPIKKFFINLWNNWLKRPVMAFFNFLKKIFWDYQPAVLIYKNWSKIVEFFSNLWAKVKEKFWQFVKWFKDIHVAMFNAGKNIINSIWEGIKAMVNKPIELVKNMVQKIRNFLPFSPAKDGPLRDIHKIRLIETITESIKPASLINKMRNVAKLTFDMLTGKPGTGTQPIAAAVGGSGGTTNVSFNIHLNGRATSDDANLVIAEIKKAFPQLMKNYQANQTRVKF